MTITPGDSLVAGDNFGALMVYMWVLGSLLRVIAFTPGGVLLHCQVSLLELLLS